MPRPIVNPLRNHPFLPVSLSAALLALLLPLFLLASCGPSTETIVVGGEARGPEATEEEEDAPEDREPGLAVLKIGESNRILSMDPLFALNNATKRMIQFTYEGLVRLDQDDGIVPAAARRWEVSGDSLAWTFYLRRDLFFHDDESFAQGRGRRVHARDVVRIFERMASRDVPSNAAGLFMNTIQGFEPYFLEQQEVFFSRDRQITRISGLEATSDSTVVFRLLEPESDFLAKLASPYAVLYPSEPFRFRDEGLHRHAVGTGPFRYESSVGDSIHMFVRNANYYGRDDRGRRLPLAARIELMNVTDEMRLYEHFRRGRLNLIADAGPRTIDLLFGGEAQPAGGLQNDDDPDADDNLQTDVNSQTGDDSQTGDNPETGEIMRSGSNPQSGAENNHRVKRLPNPDPVVLRYHIRNRFGLNRSDAAAVIRHVTPELIASEWVDPSLTITYKDEEYSQANIGRVFRRFGEDSDHRLVLAFNQDQLPRLLGRVITESMDANLQRVMVQRRVFSSDIFLYLDYLQSVVPGVTHERQPEELMRIETDRFMLLDRQIEGIRTNSLNWWMDLRHARRTGPARQPEAFLDR